MFKYGSRRGSVGGIAIRLRDGRYGFRILVGARDIFLLKSFQIMNPVQCLSRFFHLGKFAEALS